MKDRADLFDTMIESESKIRLDESGWKARCVEKVWGNVGRSDLFDMMIENESKIHPFHTCRYYQEKMGVAAGGEAAVVSEIVKAYVEGLSWVMRYGGGGEGGFRVQAREGGEHSL